MALSLSLGNLFLSASARAARDLTKVYDFNASYRASHTSRSSSSTGPATLTPFLFLAFGGNRWRQNGKWPCRQLLNHDCNGCVGVITNSKNWSW